MKRDDDLLRLAFGELSAEAARAVEAQAAADPQAKAELEAFRDLRSGLQHLPPPPPDTLSAERLRAAILDRELASKRRAPLFGWAWAPVALAGLAFVAILPRHASTTAATPQIVAMEYGGKGLVTPDFGRTFSRDFKDAVEMPKTAGTVSTDEEGPAKTPEDPSLVAASVEPASAEPRAVRRTERRTVRRRAPVKKAVETPKTDVVAEIKASVLSAPVAMMAKGASVEPETIAVPSSEAHVASFASNARSAAPAGTETVVIVSSKRDLATGANAATEMEATNVLVGG